MKKVILGAVLLIVGLVVVYLMQAPEPTALAPPLPPPPPAPSPSPEPAPPPPKAPELPSPHRATPEKPSAPPSQPLPLPNIPAPVPPPPEGEQPKAAVPPSEGIPEDFAAEVLRGWSLGELEDYWFGPADSLRVERLSKLFGLPAAEIVAFKWGIYPSPLMHGIRFYAVAHHVGGAAAWPKTQRVIPPDIEPDPRVGGWRVVRVDSTGRVVSLEDCSMNVDCQERKFAPSGGVISER